MKSPLRRISIRVPWHDKAWVEIWHDKSGRIVFTASKMEHIKYMLLETQRK
jgi:hypothetical protein